MQTQNLPVAFYQAIKQAGRLNLWVKASNRSDEPRFVVTEAECSVPLTSSDDIAEIRDWLRGYAARRGVEKSKPERQ